jgi:predicted transcriptional regulator
MAETNLTPLQMQVMDAVWSAGPGGIKVVDIWQSLAKDRPIARTTVLTLVQRLEQQGWLQRVNLDGIARYMATRGREEAACLLVGQFRDAFFGGSAAALVSSLLGGSRLKPKELRKIQQLLDEHQGSGKGPKEGQGHD